MTHPAPVQVVRRLAFAASVAAVVVAFGSAALAAMPGDRAGVHGPVVLSDSKLDTLTARGITASLNLMATAMGPSVTTSSEGSVRTARTTVLQIEVEPASRGSSGEPIRARLVATTPADLLFAAGSATARGQNNAQCTAKLNLSSTLDYMMQMSTTSITPTLATCSCATFGISLSP